jgi:hypothetical protein
MKTIKTLLFAAIIAIVLISCGNSKDEITKKVRSAMEEKFKGRGITIKSFGLAKKSGNEYSGVLETSELYGNFTYSVEVVDDGENIKWETTLIGPK